MRGRERGDGFVCISACADFTTHHFRGLVLNILWPDTGPQTRIGDPAVEGSGIYKELWILVAGHFLANQDIQVQKLSRWDFDLRQSAGCL